MTCIDLSGQWQCVIRRDNDTITAPIAIPGSLDESGIGFPDAGGYAWHPDADVASDMAGESCIATRLTRRVTHEGAAEISRSIATDIPCGKRVFLEVERSRHLTLKVNGQPVPCLGEVSISTPYVFELTGLLTNHDVLTLTADNSYPGWPHDAIVYSSAATDETQTNWNGLLGYVRLRVEDEVFVPEVRVLPRADGLRVCAVIDASRPWAGTLTFTSPALLSPCVMAVQMQPGVQTFTADALPIRPDARLWDLQEGHLHPLTAALSCGAKKTVTFGIRRFAANADGRLTLNGRVIFLRSEANCAEFPETGHPPMDVASWTRILGIYRSYGVNCMRFHSHIPPEAAFTAADEIGMLMQPELSHWNPHTAFEDDASQRYYRAELIAALRMLANHPSFVMLTYGNELAAGEVGHAYMDALTTLAHQLDDTRLYANASNGEYGGRGCDAQSDFYASQSFYDRTLRATSAGMKGHLNESYPNARTDYSSAMAALRKTYTKPVFTFEVGQYEVLPDFDELADFHGVTRPDNYALIQRRVQERGLTDVWKRYVAATGELSLRCYREEVEAVLRTESLSGISLLGLQDFPGQGTALVGMLNAHLQPKPFPFAQPERFRAFFTDVLPLAMLERYTYEAGETLCAEVKLANYAKHALTDGLRYSLSGEGFRVEGQLAEVTAPVGGLTALGTLCIPLTGISRAEKLTLHLSFGGAQNDYPLWVYPSCTPVCPEGVHECRALDEAAKAVLAQGGTVYLSPASTREALPDSIQAQFSTDFWSVGTFPFQEGGMGQLIDAAHPLFADFPTDAHTDWQWWPMATQRAVILPERYDAIITEMDCYAHLRPMAQLLEARCGGGRLLLSTLGLQALQQYPECRALQGSIYRYLASADFAPAQELPLEVAEALVKAIPEK